MITLFNGAPSANIFTYISTQTASASTNLDFTSLSNTYRAYRFVLTNLILTDLGAILRLSLSTDNFSTTASLTASIKKFAGSTATTGGIKNSGSGTTIDLNSSSAVNQTSRGFVDIAFIGESTIQAQINFDASTNNTDTTRRNFMGYISDINRESINAVRFIVSAGTITSGSINLYGIS